MFILPLILALVGKEMFDVVGAVGGFFLGLFLWYKWGELQQRDKKAQEKEPK